MNTPRENELERMKAARDALLYGSGYMRLDADGSLHHVPLQDIQIKAHAKPDPTGDQHG